MARPSRLTSADLRRLAGFRVSKYMQHADGTVLVEFFAPADAPGSFKPPKDEPAEPTPDEWLRQQYDKPDGT
jgi:hypothetical protein